MTINNIIPWAVKSLVKPLMKCGMTASQPQKSSCQLKRFVRITNHTDLMCFLADEDVWAHAEVGVRQGCTEVFVQAAPVLTAQHIWGRRRAECLQGFPAHLKTHARCFFSDDRTDSGASGARCFVGFRQQQGQRVSSKHFVLNSLIVTHSLIYTLAEEPVK